MNAKKLQPRIWKLSKIDDLVQLNKLLYAKRCLESSEEQSLQFPELLAEKQTAY